MENVLLFLVGSAVVAALVLGVLWWLSGGPSPIGQPAAEEEDSEDWVVIHEVGRGPNAPCLSPFPLKLQTFCRMAAIKYKVVHDHKMSTKGKTPWMEYRGERVADSQFCVERLSQRLAVDLSAHLTRPQWAAARALQKMAEENLYWTMCGWTFGRDLAPVTRLLPFTGVKAWLFVRLLRHVVRKEMWHHGIGRHSDMEVWHIGRGDLLALSYHLGANKFMMGDEPSEVDCAVFGMLAMVCWQMVGSPHELLLKGECSNLRDYCYRMRERYWPDWERKCRQSLTEADAPAEWTPPASQLTAPKQHQTATQRHQTATQQHQPAAQQHQTATQQHQPIAQQHETATQQHQTATQQHQTVIQQQETAPDDDTASSRQLQDTASDEATASPGKPGPEHEGKSTSAPVEHTAPSVSEDSGSSQQSETKK